jgi:hypothetical protein
MGRHAKLRRKGEYWATDAGGKTTYFGRTDEVPFGVPQKRFCEFVGGRSVSEAIRYTNIGTLKTTVFWHEARLFCPDQITNPLSQGRRTVCVCMYTG